MGRKRIVVLGSTGSIGVQTLDIVRARRDRLQVVGLACHRDAAALCGQVREFQPEAACLVSPEAAAAVREQMPSGVTLYWTIQNIISIIWTVAAQKLSNDEEKTA